ncbi:MAG: FG-GAP-like repeat-containing protein [Phycisphaerales bacterium]
MKSFNGPDMEFMGGGGAAGDFDRDGDIDLFLVGGSASVDHLYINDGYGHFVDMGAAAGIDRTHQGTGVAAGDYDNDGYLDVYVTSLGPPGNRQPGHNILWHNNGDGTFTDVTAAAGVAYASSTIGESFGSSFGDYDLDGDLDLAVSGWQGGSRLYQNNGDGTFTDVTTTALDYPMGIVRGFSPKFVDMNHDRYPELLWVADFYTSKYFINNTDGTFTESTATAQTGLDSNGMGNTFADYNNDGVFDWYVSSRITHDGAFGSGNMLYMGTATPHVYNENSVALNVNDGYWGWGVVSVDFNHDGAVDIFETNGFDSKFSNDPSILFQNTGSGSFVDATTASGISDAGQGRGLLNADFDGDGDQDIMVFNNDQPLVYYQNEISGPDTNAITLRFDTAANPALAPDGIGTFVTFESDSFTQIRYHDGGTSYLSQSELSVHVGIGSDPSATITIEWANGDTATYPNVAPGQYTMSSWACPADLNGDGSINFFDVSAYLTLFTTQHPQGDLTGDGQFNFFDVSQFLASLSAGCP